MAGPLDDRRRQAEALTIQGLVAASQGRHRERPGSTARPPPWPATTEAGGTPRSRLTNLGNVLAAQGATAEARSNYEESLRLRREHGDTWGLVLGALPAGDAHHGRGPLRRRRALPGRSARAIAPDPVPPGSTPARSSVSARPSTWATSRNGPRCTTPTRSPPPASWRSPPWPASRWPDSPTWRSGEARCARRRHYLSEEEAIEADRGPDHPGRAAPEPGPPRRRSGQ